MAGVVKVTLNSQALIDISDSTVEASKVLTGYVGYEGDGDRFTGSYVPPSTISVSAFTTSSNGTFTAPSGYAYSPVTVNVEGGGSSGDYLEERAKLGNYYSTTSVQIPSYAFYTTGITGADMPFCPSIGNHAFFFCSQLLSASFSTCKTIGGSAFNSCTQLSTIYFPECTTISSYVFSNCSQLLTADFPSCVTIGSNAFHSCSRLSTANFPSCANIAISAFRFCSQLSTVSFPRCTTIGSFAFQNCVQLSNVYFPTGKTLGSAAFLSCTQLSTVSFPMCSTIGTNTFQYCYGLLSAYFLGSSVPKLQGSLAFAYTPMSDYTESTGGVYGSIFVRASLYDAFISASNWSLYSARIVSLADAEIEALG